MEPVPSKVTRTYPQRGPLQQFRFAESTAFRCFRCGTTKKSKLITIYQGSWSRRLCNGCYGRLLSIYNVKAGDGPENERCEALAVALIGFVATEDRREAERAYRTSDARVAHLAPEAVRFIATAEHVASGLQTVIHSRRRRETSAIVQLFLRIARDWSGSDWILDPTGFHQLLTMLTRKYRNRAAHLDELGERDYSRCRELVMGPQGIVWKLVDATRCHR